MAKQPKPTVDTTETEVVEEFYPAETEVEYTDVTGKDDLPDGVADPAEEVAKEPAKKPAAKKAESKVTEKKDEDEVPADLKEKTPAQLAKMYKEAQSVIGRQGTELGELRRTADTYIKAHMKATTPKPAQPAPEKEPDDVDFFTDPTAAIERAIARHPALKKLEGATRTFAEREVQRHRQGNAAKFSAKHPDAGEILAEEGFREWVGQSPIRQALLLRAHQQYDFTAGDEVFSTWKALKAAKTPAEPEVTPEVKPVAKVAVTKPVARVPSGGNASPRGKGGEGKIYRRADIIKLMQEDRPRYEAMSEELELAYKEKRVR